MIYATVDPAGYTTTAVAYGLSAHAGSSGMRSTGQVGPSVITPRTPVVGGGPAEPAAYAGCLRHAYVRNYERGGDCDNDYSADDEIFLHSHNYTP